MACTPTPAGPVVDGTIDDLHRHLHATVNLELWTIPLYLTALCSIAEDGSSVELPGVSGGPSTVTDLLASVALQEMYHLQLAGNLCLAFEVTPELNWPTYDGEIPYVSSLPADGFVGLGTATDPKVLELLVAVETPDDIATQPTIQYGPDGLPCYRSIGDLYSVVRQLVDKFKAGSPAYPTADQFTSPIFDSWYPAGSGYPGTVASQTEADAAVRIIVDQGEGATGGQDAPLPVDDEPVTTGYPHPWHAQDQLSHVDRFSLIQSNANAGITAWPITGADATAEQADLSAVFAQLLSNIAAGWTSGTVDLQPMVLMRAAITQVFRAGAIPTFAQPTAGAPTYAEAAAALAPTDGATWDENVQYYFSHTEAGAMDQVEGGAFQLADQSNVHSNQQTIEGAVQGTFMPPGIGWPDELIEGFTSWDGS